MTDFLQVMRKSNEQQIDDFSVLFKLANIFGRAMFGSSAALPRNKECYRFVTNVTVLLQQRFGDVTTAATKEVLIMSLNRSALCLALMLAPAALHAQSAPTEATPIGYDELKRGQNVAAIQEIMANDALPSDDPARNINLAVAFAREGDATQAQAHFRAALLSENRVTLQTAQGEWVDSRELARQGLRKLARGAFNGEQFASSR